MLKFKICSLNEFDTSGVFFGWLVLAFFLGGGGEQDHLRGRSSWVFAGCITQQMEWQMCDIRRKLSYMPVC